MKIELVPNTTEVIEIITKYRTILRIDNDYEVNIVFTEILLDLDSEKSSSDTTVDIEDIPSHLTLDQAVELKNNIEKYIDENINDIIQSRKI